MFLMDSGVARTRKKEEKGIYGTIVARVSGFSGNCGECRSIAGLTDR
jgi:hypothetical protein